MAQMPKISPALMFNDQAEQAAQLYVSLFNNSRIKHIHRYGANQPGPEGQVATVSLVLDGQDFVFGNGGPQFTFSMGLSLFVSCDTQEEIDRIWNGLTSNGGFASMCGWLTDPFGVSWQINARYLTEVMAGDNGAKKAAVFQALMGMQKVDIAKLQEAADGVPA